MSECANSDLVGVYETQLVQIRQALPSATGQQRTELEQLEKDLLELIELTQPSSTACSVGEGLLESSQSNLENELAALEGMKCQVPFQYEWGGLGYHNAIILSAEAEAGSVSVQVVFMHPTSKRMQPCPYFLEGECKYPDDKCHYSHGYLAKLDTIKDYIEADYTKITEGSSILAKYKDEFWYKGHVLSVQAEGDEHRYLVKFNHCEDTLTLDLCSIYPLNNEDSGSSGQDSDFEDEESQFVPRHLQECKGEILEHEFGSWEKYTKGIGSKLMAKMGYVFGSGLGKECEGRTEPVEAIVFPPGRSLDRCMELREKAGKGNMFTVEKALERKKKKEEIRLRQMAKAAAEKSISVFDFINLKLTKKTKQEAGAQRKAADLRNVSGETLNVESLRLSEDIRRAEREIEHLKQSLKRHSERRDLTSSSRIESKIADKEKELAKLVASEKTISNEQRQRKNSSKLTIF